MNPRPFGPEPNALAKLRYSPFCNICLQIFLSISEIIKLSNMSYSVLLARISNSILTLSDGPLKAKVVFWRVNGII